MNERLDQHRISLDLQRLNELLHGFLMMFAPKLAEAEAETDIDGEDGEIDDQTEPPGR